MTNIICSDNIIITTFFIQYPWFSQNRDRRTRNNTPSSSSANNETGTKNATPHIIGIMTDNGCEVSFVWKVTSFEQLGNYSSSVKKFQPCLPSIVRLKVVRSLQPIPLLVLCIDNFSQLNQLIPRWLIRPWPHQKEFIIFSIVLIRVEDS